MPLMPWRLGQHCEVLASARHYGAGRWAEARCCLWSGLGTREKMPDYFQWVGGPWFHGPSPAEAPVAPAASLIQLRVKAISLGGPDAGLVPAVSVFQGVPLLPHGRGVLAVVTAFGAGGGRIPEVLGNGSMATPSRRQGRGMG